jgi:hypothetical protein
MRLRDSLDQAALCDLGLFLALRAVYRRAPNFVVNQSSAKQRDLVILRLQRIWRTSSISSTVFRSDLSCGSYGVEVRTSDAAQNEYRGTPGPHARLVHGGCGENDVTALLIGILFAALVMSSGYGVLRLSRLASGATAFGLAPAAGLGALIVATVWIGFIGLPPLAGTLILVCGVALGVGLAFRDRQHVVDAFRAAGELRLTFALVALSLLVPAIVLGGAFNSVVVPLSTDDGAHHVEIINLLRQGGQWAGWYPRGFHSLSAAFLQLMPNVDTALGALGIGMGLALLAPVGVFGLGVVFLGRPSAAALGSVLVGLTALYPYQMQFWDGWPLAVGIILSTSLWCVGVCYLERPGYGWAFAGAIISGATLLTHGTELFTAAIGLAFVLIAGRRRVHWKVLPWHLIVALLVAGAVVAPYLTGLLDFYQQGGAQSAGAAELAKVTAVASNVGYGSSTLQSMSDVVGGIVVDVPLRLSILVIGVVSAFRARKARLVAMIGLTFLGLAFGLQADVPAANRLYALAFPWSMDYRLLTITAICTSVLAGAGLLRISEWRSRVSRRSSALALLVVAAMVGVGTMFVVEQRLAAQVPRVLTYTRDDAAALDWLSQHVEPGDLVVNDGSSDAGIWAPYKGGASIVLPRVLPVPDRNSREELVAHISDLNDSPDAVASACDLGARYVYVGSAGTAFEARQFPVLNALQQSSGLDEVFSQGAAAVFRLHCH